MQFQSCFFTFQILLIPVTALPDNIPSKKKADTSRFGQIYLFSVVDPLKSVKIHLLYKVWKYGFCCFYQPIKSVLIIKLQFEAKSIKSFSNQFFLFLAALVIS
jgi:hypothetical protein